jgi:putative heme-binding domain-containing protein
MYFMSRCLLSKACLTLIFLLSGDGDGRYGSAARADDGPNTIADLLKGAAPTLERVLPWLDTDDPDLQRALLELAGRQPAWSDAAARLVRDWLADARRLEEYEREFTGLLQTFGREEKIERLVAGAWNAAGTTRPVRLLLLRVLARVRLEPLPAAWQELIGRALGEADSAVCHEAICAVRSRQLTTFDKKLWTLSEQTDLATELRIAALSSSASRQRQLPASAFTLLTEHLSKEAPPLIRLSAARALGASRLDVQQLRQLATQIGKADATIGMLLLPAFARARDAALGRALLENLSNSSTEQSLTVNDLDRIPLMQLDGVQVSARGLRDRMVARERDHRNYLAKVDSELPPGDAKRGEKVFFSERASCATCHRSAGRGGGLGPNLSRIGFLRDRQQLLESVVLPSAYVAPEFRAYTLLTRRGNVVVGLIHQETSDALHLRSAPATRTRVARSDIEDITIARTSLMPEGLDKQLTRQELSDLIEFLASQR